MHKILHSFFKTEANIVFILMLITYGFWNCELPVLLFRFQSIYMYISLDIYALKTAKKKQQVL